MKTAVITGATGAVGRSLIKICIEAGYEVLAVVHRESPRTKDLKTIDHCHVLELNLDEYERGIEELSRQDIKLSGYELFFHLAWMASFGKDRDNIPLQLDNIRAALSAVRFAKDLGCSTFIGAGSQAEYGRVEGILSSSTPTFPETGYGIAKLSAGEFTRLLCEQLGICHIWCRILSVYGPDDREQTLISTAIIKMMENAETEFSPCDQMWDYIYSDDAARAMLIAAEKGSHGKIYVIGSGEVRPLKEYIERIAEITDYKREIGFGRRPYNEKQVMYLQADIGELSGLGYKPEYSFEEGVKSIIRWRNRI